jgi:hypothetical protein
MVKVKLSFKQVVETYRFVGCRGSHSFENVGSKMAVRLLALRAGRPLPPKKIYQRLRQPQDHSAAGRI